MKRVATGTVVSDESYALIERAYGSKLDIAIMSAFEMALEELVSKAEKKLDSEGRLYTNDEEAS
jgi:hypothetical protein